MEEHAPFTWTPTISRSVTPCASWPGTAFAQGHPRASRSEEFPRTEFGELGAADLLGLCLPRSSVAGRRPARARHRL